MAGGVPVPNLTNMEQTHSMGYGSPVSQWSENRGENPFDQNFYFGGLTVNRGFPWWVWLLLGLAGAGAGWWWWKKRKQGRSG